MAQFGTSRRAFWVVPLIALITLVMLSPSFSVVGPGGAGVAPTASSLGAVGATPIAATPSASPSTATLSSSSTATASEVQALLQARPSLANVPWVENLLHPAKDSTPLVSLPNLALLEHPAKVVNGEVALSYTTQPAPMGLADFGIGANGPYALNASSIMGSITFETPPAATNPGSQELVAPSEQTLGAIGSPYTFGIQLNTILQNVELPGVTNGTFWTQNVVNINSTGIHFVQDVFNFTYASNASHEGVIPTSGTLVSGCNDFNLTAMLTVYGGVYQCVGGTVPIRASNFPMTLTFFNNASINSNNQDLLTFGYLFTGANGFHSGGTLDQLVFNSPGAPLTPPAQPPQFTINGFQTNAIGLYDDAELTLAGGIGGANGVFSTINSTMSLEYTNYTTPTNPGSNTGYQNVPSAFNFGDDTGETTTGVATYWTGTGSSDAVVHEDTGPALLYGLWNTPADVSAAPGAIHISGTITPGYGFVFAGNVDPTVSLTNLSYVPTASGTGSFSTWVPPAAAGSVLPNGWYFQSWAPKAAELNGSNAGGPGPVTSSVTGYNITLSASASLNAPLYMDGDAQAASLALNVTGSGTAPFDFSSLVVNPNITFRHLNDFGFPTFVVFQAQGLTEPVQVNNISQSITSTTYIYDSVENHTLGFPSPPVIFTGLQNYSKQFNVWDSQDAKLSDLNLTGIRAFPGATVAGGVALLWDDTGASVTDASIANASYGIFVGDSMDTSIHTVSASTGSNAVDDVSSHGTSVVGLTVSGSSTFGVYGLDSSHGSYGSINAVTGSYGVYAGEFVGPGPYAYYNSLGITSAVVEYVAADAASFGSYLFLSDSNDISHSVSPVVLVSTGNQISNSTQVVAADLSGSGPGAIGSALVAKYDTLVEIVSTTATGGAAPVAVQNSTEVYIIGGTATNGSMVAYLSGDSSVLATGLVANGPSAVGAEILDSAFIQSAAAPSLGTAFAAMASNGAFGLELGHDRFVSVSGVDVASGGTGVFGVRNFQVGITGLSATNATYGVLDDGSVGVVVTNVTSTGSIAAVEFAGTQGSIISGLHSTGDQVGVQLGCDLVTLFAFGYCASPSQNAASNDTITQSVFHNDMTYGVELGSAVGASRFPTTSNDVVYANDFIDNNGAGTTYNPLNAQAWADSGSDVFYLSGPAGTSPIGNYWSDGHTAVNGAIPPYAIPDPGAVGGITYDWYPLAAPVGTAPPTYTVTLTETGLPSGTSWSATLNGVLQSSTTPSITFTVPAGSYAYLVAGISGYTVFPNSGTISVSANYMIPVTFSGVSYSVAIAEGGLPAGTTWSVTLGGTTVTTNQTTATFIVPNGTYTYAVGNVTGYTISSGHSGTVVVRGAGSIQTVGFAKTPPPPPAAVGLFGLSQGASYALLGGLVVVAIIVGVLAGYFGGKASKKP